MKLRLSRRMVSGREAVSIPGSAKSQKLKSLTAGSVAHSDLWQSTGRGGFTRGRGCCLPGSFHQIDDAGRKSLGRFLLSGRKGMAHFRCEADTAGLLREFGAQREMSADAESVHCDGRPMSLPPRPSVAVPRIVERVSLSTDLRISTMRPFRMVSAVSASSSRYGVRVRISRCTASVSR